MNNKQYLISFLASIQGDKLVVSGLRKMQRESDKTGKRGDKLGKKTKSLGQQMVKLALRAALTIPIWLALRSIFMGIITTIRDMITANLDLEEGLARIKTVVSASSKTIDTDMARIKQKILDVAVKTRTPIKELAEAFYFLRTANLSTQQAMDAFEPVVNAMVGTMNNAKDTARAVAGIFNTMGDAIGDNLTDLEKMQKISDLLTFTYATQDVQLQELTESYTKFAPYVSGLSDDFTEIITTLGFLNTHLLRAGRTGRLTGRAILQLTKNSSKLADIFGITFDPDKPIKFLEVIENISKQIKTQRKITSKQGDMIQEVFATRAGVAVRILINNFDELKRQIKRANEEAEGFAKRMKAIREETTRAQFGRLKNILAVLTHEFLNNALAGMTLAQGLKAMNDTLEDSRDDFRQAGTEVGYYTANLQLLMRTISNIQGASEGASFGLKQMSIAMGMGKTTWQTAPYLATTTPSMTSVRLFKIGLDALIDSLGISREEQQKKHDEFQAQIEADRKALEDFTIKQKADAEATEVRRNTLKEIQQAIKHQVNLMKLIGASELEIAKFKREALDLELGQMAVKDQIIKSQQDINNLIEKELQQRKIIKDQILNAQITILKTLGASESDIIDMKKRELDLMRDTIGESQYLIDLEDLRLQKAVAITKEKRREWDAITGLFGQFSKADELERGRIKRAIELTQLKPKQVAWKYRTNIFDREIIDDFFSHFSAQSKDAVNKTRNDIFKLGVDFPKPRLELDIEEKMKFDFASSFWQPWEKRALKAIELFKEKMLEAQKTVLELSQQPSVFQTGARAKLETEHPFRLMQSERASKLIVVKFGDQMITIKGKISEEVIELIAKKQYDTVKKLLLDDQTFKHNLSEDM